MANVKISELPLGNLTSTSIFPFVDGGTTYQGAISAITSNSTVEVTYDELYSLYTGGTLTSGIFYLMTDYQTCYDQPNYNSDSTPITTGNYKTGTTEPILLLATSTTGFSPTVYSTLYPQDKISYDISWNLTEVTSGPAKGRITERIDEFNNRTDYDHRTILFKRYRLYTNREGLRLNGTIELLNDGTVEGNNTSFTALTVGDVVYIPNADPSYYEIVTIDDNVTMTVSGDTIDTAGAGSVFYLAVEEITNDDEYGGYFSYKRTNVKTDDFIEYTTFGDAISENYAKNNYVGNYANNYTNISDGTFILANNVFIQGEYESNKFGDYCYNNTWGTDNGNNTWGDYCYNNVSTNDIDDSIIGHYFHDNLINTNITDNHIGNDFNNNQLLAENDDDFEDNIIGNGFNNNIIYSRFYKNEILDGFNNNTIGDFGNLTENVFYRNYIRNNFNNNTIREEFQNNQIGTNFQDNTINGEFIGNTILNGFNNNQTGDYFALNNIGNGYNNNKVYDDFYNNSTGYYFYNNIVSYDFNENNVGIDFRDNRPYNYTLFGWNDLSTLSTRNYELFNDAVSGDLDNKVLGKELVMKIISTSQYFKIKFTQWTQSNNGGGFQYDRQEIDSNGNNIGSAVTFTKTNYGSEVDIIVEGVVEITRGDSDGIYNIATEGSWNSSVSPQDTEWNSIYTQTNNGNNFRNNVIGNNFEDNIIGDNFEDNQIGFDFQNNEIINDFNKNEIASGFNNNSISGETSTNRIGEQFENNTIYGDFYDNQIFNEFKGNITYDSFYQNRLDWGFGGNQISGYCSQNTFGPNIDSNDFLGDVYQNTFKGGVFSNTIGNNFANNNIGVGFSNNTIGENFGNGGGEPQGNTIGNYFVDNTIGEYFYNNTIADNFENNTIGDYFQWNIVNTVINNTDFTTNYGNITGVTYVANGTTGTDAVYTDLSGTTNGIGTGATFDVEVSGGAVIGVSGFSDGRLYQTGNTITILGTQISGATPADDVVITVTGISVNPSVYETYTCQIFERQGGNKRLSYYDSSDTLTIKNINE